jgi:hypothetical protein
MSARHITVHCRVDAQAEKLLERATDRLGLSARAVHRVLKVARTIADLAGSESVAAGHVAEAIRYRSLDWSSPAGGNEQWPSLESKGACRDDYNKNTEECNVR